MNVNPSSVVEDDQEEIAALVRNLQEIQQRLEELTGGQVDAVVHPGGQFFLLHEAQEQLRQSEARFQGVYTVAAIGIAIVTPDGRYLQANAAFCRMLGYTESELRALDSASVTHPEDLPHDLNIRGELLAGLRENYVLEKRYLKKNGDIIWARASVSATHAAGGEIDTLILVAEDITEKKLAEEVLRRQTAELKIIFDLLPAMIWVKDSHNVILRINQQAAQATGKPVEFLEGKSMLEIYPREAAKYYADDLDVMAAGRPKLGIVEKLRSPEGTDVWIQTDKVPIPGHGGEITGIVVMSQDITERKRTESRFRRLVESNAQGVMFWNTNGEITEANDAFLNLIRHDREDLKSGGINWMTLTPPEYAHLDRRALEEIASKGVSAPYEKELVRKDGSRVPVLLGAAAFEDRPNEGVCFFIDLTERKKLEQQFFRAQRMESIGTLAGGIAHDLNNILAPIMMSIDLLKRMMTNPQGSQMLATIEVSARQGADIVRQVLSFARGLESERIEIQPKHLLLDLENIIKGTFPKNIELEFGIPNGIWTIWGDPTQVNQVLLNLCVNARDAMPNGGHLTFEVENFVLDEHYAAMNPQARPGRYVQINVTDSGAGMPQEVIEKIFEPFFTTKEMGKGTGLGLSTVMAIVKSHEGIVNVYSEPGKGTTFKVYLPAVEASVDGQKKLTQQISPPRGNGETVLVIDDEASILTITGQTLQAFGYRVLTARDGAEAIAVYAEHQDEIAVVLTDMMMPVMDGAATIRALMRMNPSVKIVAASGLNANGNFTKISNPNVRHFLTKPYTAGALLTTLRATLDEADRG
jgi:PAS domain S-box-containing protein